MQSLAKPGPGAPRRNGFRMVPGGSVLLAALIAAGAMAASPASAQATNGNYRTRTVTVFGNDPCPVAENPDEIIVCARRPEEERYRIPKKLRDEAREEKMERRDNVPARRAALVDRRATSTGGPGSCSAIGGAGASGCTTGIDLRKAGETIIEGVEKATEPDD